MVLSSLKVDHANQRGNKAGSSDKAVSVAVLRSKHDWLVAVLSKPCVEVVSMEPNHS